MIKQATIVLCLFAIGCATALRLPGSYADGRDIHATWTTRSFHNPDDSLHTYATITGKIWNASKHSYWFSNFGFLSLDRYGNHIGQTSAGLGVAKIHPNDTLYFQFNIRQDTLGQINIGDFGVSQID